MNPEKPSRDEIEAKLTALLLGELPDDEAALLRWAIMQDIELAKLHDRLKLAIGLVREVAAKPTEAVPLKLADERREKLLAHFKQPRPQESFWLKRMELPSLVTALVVLGIVALLAALLLPSLASAKRKAQRVTMLSGNAAPDLSGKTWAADKSPAQSAHVNVALALPPVAAIVPPEPSLVPAPTEIVLPQPESPPEVAAQTGMPADTFGNARGGDTANIQSHGTHSFGITGGSGGGGSGGGGEGVASMTAPAPASTPAQPKFESFDGSISSPDIAAAVAKELAKSGSGTLALNGVNSFAGGSGGGGASSRSGIAGPLGALPQEKLPEIALSRVAGEGAGETKLKVMNSYQPLTAGLRDRDGDFLNAGNSFYRTPAGEQNDINGPVPSPVAPPAATAPATELYFDTDANRAQGADDSKLMDKAGSSTLALYPNKTYSSGMAGATGKPAAGSSFQQRLQSTIQSAAADNEIAGPAATQPAASAVVGGTLTATPGVSATTQDNDLLANSAIQKISRGDVGGLRYLTSSSNLPADDFVPAVTLNQDQLRTDYSQRPYLAGQMEAAKEKDQAAAVKSQPYWEAKRNLANMVDFHKLLAARIESEKIAMATPKSSVAEITQLAEPAKGRTVWQKLTGEVESKATINMENDAVSDIAELSGKSAAVIYDPYYVQSTLETIQSDAVLGKAVDALKLDDALAKNNGGEKLEKKAAIALLKKRLDLHAVPNTTLVEIGATSDKPEEAAKIANAVALAYSTYRTERHEERTVGGIKVLEEQYSQEEQRIRLARAELDRLARETSVEPADVPIRKPIANAPIPQPEILTRDNAFSTFSLNVSDVAFKLAAASLEKGQMPEAASIRSEEFINAFDYRDPEAAAGEPIAFTSERARYPFAQNRDLLRFSVKTAAAGRPAGRALSLVVLLDNSGSMERADRVQIIREALRVLATQLQPQDTVSVVTFARTARLWADGVPGDKAGETLDQVGGITPQGGTNLEEALRLAYETARRHYLANGLNRVVLLTDGAANLGNVDAAVLKEKVEANRKQGIALDCFGIGWEGFNDDLLEQLSSNGDGRYAFLNSPEEASQEFAAKLAGALQVAASDVKVQVEFNPQRVISYRQIGYAKHQLTKEQFRDNTVDAAEIAAQEAGNALYTVEIKPDGTGPAATVRVRYKVPGTTDYRERSWDVPYAGGAVALAQSSAAMRLAATAGAFSEWLASSPFAQEVTPDELLKGLSGVPEIYGADQRPKKLEWMIRQAKSLSGK